MQEHITDITDWAIESLTEMQEPPLGYGLFIVKFDNNRKRVRGKPLQTCECWGTLYPSGHVHLDTEEYHLRDFRSLQQMQDHFEVLGKYEIEWQLGGVE
jgi:hypothetical protein